MPQNTEAPIRTGIMCGSFNPLHMGHIMLANYICAYENIDEVWLVVTPNHPAKNNKHGELADAAIRLDMGTRFCRPYPQITVCDIEFRLPAPNYTIHTLKALNEQHPNRRFSLLLGEDNWAHFDKWYQSAQLLNEVEEVLVYPRKNCKQYTRNYPANVRKVNAPLLEISSTFVRKALQENRNVCAFLPVGEYEYLVNNAIYKLPC